MLHARIVDWTIGPDTLYEHIGESKQAKKHYCLRMMNMMILVASRQYYYRDFCEQFLISFIHVFVQRYA